MYNTFNDIILGGVNVYITKVQEINSNQNTTTIPKDIVLHLKIAKGERIIWEVDVKGNVKIKKLKV